MNGPAVICRCASTCRQCRKDHSAAAQRSALLTHRRHRTRDRRADMQLGQARGLLQEHGPGAVSWSDYPAAARRQPGNSSQRWAIAAAVCVPVLSLAGSVLIGVTRAKSGPRRARALLRCQRCRSESAAPARRDRATRRFGQAFARLRTCRAGSRRSVGARGPTHARTRPAQRAVRPARHPPGAHPVTRRHSCCGR